MNICLILCSFTNTIIYHFICVQEKEAMSRRAGVLNLMLHSTFNHDMAKMMQQKKSRTAAAGQASAPKVQKRV